MDLLKNDTIRKLQQNELEASIIKVKRHLLDLRFKQATRQEVKPHTIKQYKNQLSRLLTIEAEIFNTK